MGEWVGLRTGMDREDKHLLSVLGIHFPCSCLRKATQSMLPFGSDVEAVLKQYTSDIQNIYVCTVLLGSSEDCYFLIHSFSILSDDRSKASSKMIPPHSAI
jgi:hypothetical protein